MKTITATKVLCFLGFCSVLTPELQGQNKGLTVTKEWHQLDYAYASEADRQQAIANHEFIPGNGLPIDTDVYYDGANNQMKIFVTVPRFQNGTPSTLSTVTQETNNGNPLLQPFPSWEWHRNSRSCHKDRLISVFRVQIDECGRLWVLDTGKIGSDQLCPPQIIAFDPSTAAVLHRYEIPSDQITAATLLVTPVVDVRDPQSGCHDTFVYAADVTGFGLIVYDVQHGNSWRIENKLFFPIPDYGTFTIAGESFDLMDGILGMTLSPYKAGTDRKLYFHALASNTENYVMTSVIRNGTIFNDHADAVPREFKVYPMKRYSQAAAEAMDRNGIMYFGAMSEISIMCWNSQTDFQQRNFVTVDGNKNNLQFASGVKIVNNRKGGQELWVLTCRIQKSYTGSMTANEVNFRILAANTEQLVRGTKCKTHGHGHGTGNGGYGFNRPQAGWGSIFSDNPAAGSGASHVQSRDTTGMSSSAVSVSASSRASSGSSDELVFN